MSGLVLLYCLLENNDKYNKPAFLKKYCIIGTVSVITNRFKDFVRCVLYVTKPKLFHTIINRELINSENAHHVFLLLTRYNINQNFYQLYDS